MGATWRIRLNNPCSVAMLAVATCSFLHVSINCLLYFNANISFKKASASGGLRSPGPLPGLRHWTPLGNFQTPSLLSCLPNNPVRSTPLRRAEYNNKAQLFRLTLELTVNWCCHVVNASEKSEFVRCRSVRLESRDREGFD